MIIYHKGSQANDLVSRFIGSLIENGNLRTKQKSKDTEQNSGNHKALVQYNNSL